MSAKTIYTCDICKEDLNDPSESFGLHFKNLTDFTFGAYSCTQGTHICYRCARQLRELLGGAEIEKFSQVCEKVETENVTKT